MAFKFQFTFPSYYQLREKKNGKDCYKQTQVLKEAIALAIKYMPPSLDWKND